jgi:hypothetical protein
MYYVEKRQRPLDHKTKNELLQDKHVRHELINEIKCEHNRLMKDNDPRRATLQKIETELRNELEEKIHTERTKENVQRKKAYNDAKIRQNIINKRIKTLGLSRYLSTELAEKVYSKTCVVQMHLGPDPLMRNISENMINSFLDKLEQLTK